jgi:Asp-tRNA(Asn)/Glu-tRNA(Gln) amidotransferase C subunit
MDTYIRNVKIIEDAFEQIKEATGISSTEEIVTTFIKAEEQNISLFNYVNVLNTLKPRSNDTKSYKQCQLRTKKRSDKSFVNALKK